MVSAIRVLMAIRCALPIYYRDRCVEVGGSGRWAAPAVASWPGAPGAWLALLPPGLGAHALPKWTISRVLFRPPVSREPARIIHLGDALLRRSSALTRTLAAASCDAVASGGPPSTASLFKLAPGGACPAAGHPAVARGLLPHDFNLACASQRTARCADQRPSAVWFLLRFPSGCPGSPLTTSLPCGARTFLPRTVVVRRRSSIHLRLPVDYRVACGQGKRVGVRRSRPGPGVLGCA